MRFFHLSDLHIGKQLHQYNLKEDQEHILDEVIAYADRMKPDAVVIAGDIYDKSVPSAEAVEIFDRFLTGLSSLEQAPVILIISGNHDSAQRLDYASGILGRQNIFIAGQAPRTKEEHIKKVTLTDSYGEVDFYLLPFLKPGYVRNVFEGEVPENYSEAVAKLLEREEIDRTRRNVLVSHQFYTGRGKTPETCDSEIFSVGGIDNVDIAPLLDFEYAALGHIHGAQKVGEEFIRYCGTLLKYSVSESGHTKSLHVVSLGEKGERGKVEAYPLHPLRDVKKFRGTMEELLKTFASETSASETSVSEASASGAKDDYVSITLTDEVDPYKPKEQLEKVFSHILEVRMDNTRTRKKLEGMEEEISISDPMSAFCDFFSQMQGRSMNEAELEVMEQLMEKMEEE